MSPLEEHLSVSFLLNSLEFGGAERAFVTLANELQRSGVEVEILGLRKGGELCSAISQDVQVRVFGGSLPVRLSRLSQHLRRRTPRVLVSGLNEPNLFASPCSAGAGRRRPKVVLTQHTHLSEDARRSPSPRVRYFPALFQLAARSADAVVAVSDGVRSDLVERHRLDRARVHVIHNPLPLEHVQERSREPVEHAWLRPDRSTPVILSVGRLHPAKGFDVLIRAVSILRRARPARLLIVGEGAERSGLEDLIRREGLSGHVQLCGFQDNPWKFMARTDVFAFSSRWEGFGVVLVEALAVGARVVATDCPTGPREILDGGRFGALTEVDDPEALAAALAAVLDDEVCSRLDAVERARSFGASGIAQRYLELFRSLLSSRGDA